MASSLKSTCGGSASRWRHRTIRRPWRRIATDATLLSLANASVGRVLLRLRRRECEIRGDRARAGLGWGLLRVVHNFYNNFTTLLQRLYDSVQHPWYSLRRRTWA